MDGMAGVYEQVLDVLDGAEVGPGEADELAELKETVEAMKKAHGDALRIVKSVA